ncbi:MAG: kinase/pyrophosphorylase [Acetobacter sp.]|jgi:regulator of PEP synthase PpsR (kinase-PPPase family)|nr:kinase/pyrophosphorylase [Acetobacter sp.]MCH4062196.1 kinase/pyrophosphorylase [Acetobacter sp.]MCH4088957.1 kinase/pyrophosphorylase [Acetobacter sp.]MCI1294534.1 kinase/pyrophosphorylase [Acetobacter sp.]MCI1321279.1 kinase/pyrophosphorylase [Acetobacter sp.]
MNGKPFILHMVSEGTGQTLEAMSRACAPHFPGTQFDIRHWNLIRTQGQLQRVMEAIVAEPGLVLSSLIDRDLEHALEDGCKKIGVNVHDIMTPTLQLLERETGEHASGRPGSQYVMDSGYHRRIDAMHYVLEHDDGQLARGLTGADVVLVGVSRVSKTPTCIYLANRGIRAANVPLVPDTPLPPELFSLDVPVIGLTIETDALVEIRRNRLGTMVRDGQRVATGLGSPDYINPEKVREELLWARRLCSKHKWPVIDVTRRSIEETSAAILDKLQHPKL